MSTTDSGTADGLEVIPPPFPPPAYPRAERLDLVEELHGHRVADPYRRLEDPAAESTVAWSAAQDELYAGYRGRGSRGTRRRGARPSAPG